MAPLEQLERQAKDTVKGQVRAAQAQVQRQTSIVRLAGAGLKPRLGRRAGLVLRAAGALVLDDGADAVARDIVLYGTYHSRQVQRAQRERDYEDVFALFDEPALIHWRHLRPAAPL